MTRQEINEQLFKRMRAARAQGLEYFYKIAYNKLSNGGTAADMFICDIAPYKGQLGFNVRIGRDITQVSQSEMSDADMESIYNAVLEFEVKHN